MEDEESRPASNKSCTSVLYPECHLNSPIILGKIVQCHVAMSVHQPYTMEDDTIIHNTLRNMGTRRETGRLANLRKIGGFMRGRVHNVSTFEFEPYPRCSKDLLRLDLGDENAALESVLIRANLCFNANKDKITDMLKETFAKGLGVGAGEIDGLLEDCEAGESIPTTARASRWYTSFKSWFTIKKTMRHLQKVSNNSANVTLQNTKWFENKHQLVFVTPEVVVILDRKTKIGHILTPELVLMYCDVVEGRWNMSTAGKLDQKTKHITDRGEKLWSLIDTQFKRLGELVFDVVALLEPLSLSLIQLKDPVDELKGAFLEFVMNEMESVLTKVPWYTPNRISAFCTRLMDILRSEEISDSAEIFSFFRTFGHPALEAVQAAEKVRGHMYAPKVLSFETIMQAHAIFCGIIISGYRERHGGQWPPCTLPEHASAVLKAAKLQGAAVTHDMCYDHWTSFSGFQFEKFLEPQLCEDLTIYMKDKALSPPYRNWDSVYPGYNMCYTPDRCDESRRLVEVFVADYDFDPKEILNYVESGEWLNDDQFNISYSLKEKEIKQAGRLFAKMTYKTRAVQVLSETLLAAGIGPLFRENGMAKNEIDLLKQLSTISISGVSRTSGDLDNSESQDYLLKREAEEAQKGPGRKGRDDKYCYKRPNLEMDDHETISAFLTTDLKKYCLNWRSETTTIFGDRCCEIFGLKQFFNWMHPVLERSTLYVGDPFCPLENEQREDLKDQPDDGIFIHNPRGGIEGYCQKMWTLISIALIHLTAVRSGSRVTAMVQGDNQAIAVTQRVPIGISYQEKKRRVHEATVRYFYHMQQVMAEVGHELKLQETVISSKFFVYSKRIYYDGQILPQCLKSLTRCVFWSETLVDETRAACSNIATSVAKSIENGYSPVVGYFYHNFKICQQLAISLGFSINPTLTRSVTAPLLNSTVWMTVAVFVPATVGGFNYMAMSRCFVRNIGDPATAAMADLKRMVKSDILTDDVLNKLMEQEPGDSTFLDWGSDPYSCNLPYSQSISAVIKNVTARSVLIDSPNPLLAGLFGEDNQEDDEDLAQFLMDRVVIMPRVCHEILDNSLTGVRESIAGMLDTTKTLIRAGVRSGCLSVGMLRRLTNHDLLQFETFTKIMKQKVNDHDLFSTYCSVDLARMIRTKLWCSISLGRKIAGLETPDPLEVVNGQIIKGYEVCSLCGAEGDDQKYSWFFVPKDIDLEDVSKPTSAIRVPYFGSTTEERSEIRLGYAKNLSKPAKAAIRIAMVYTWAFGDDEVSWEEAAIIARTRAKFTTDELKLLTPVSTSTNLSHRLRDTATQMKFAGTSLLRVSRYVTISNDKMVMKDAGESRDTNLVYQQVMLVGLSFLEYFFRHKKCTGEENTVLHLHLNPGCCIVVNEDEAKNPSQVEVEIRNKTEVNQMIYDPEPINKLDLDKLKMIRTEIHEVDFTLWDNTAILSALNIATAQTVIDTISQVDRDDLKEVVAIASDDSINSLITEFLLIDINQFCQTLGGLIVNQFAYEIYALKIDGRHLIYDHIYERLRVTSSSIFRILTNAVSHPRIFKRFWDFGVVEPNRGANMKAQDFTLHALDICMHSVEFFMNQWDCGIPFEVYLCESDLDIVDERRETFTARHLAFLCSFYGISTLSPSLQGLDSLQRYHLLKEYLEEEVVKDQTSRYWQLTGLIIRAVPSTVSYLMQSAVKQFRIRGLGVPHSVADWDPSFNDMLQSTVVNEVARASGQGVTGDVRYWGLEIPRVNIFSCSGLVGNHTDSADVLETELELPTGPSYLSHQLRIVGVNSTSCLKALELTSYISQNADLKANRLFVGEGAGAMLALYDSTLGPVMNWYNSGISSRDLTGQRELNIYPSEVALNDKTQRNAADLISRTRVLFNGRPEVTWIGTDVCERFIVESLCEDRVGLIHSDMEGGPTKDQDSILLEQYSVIRLAYQVGADDVLVITKIAPRLGTDWTRILCLFNKYWDSVSIISLRTSNPSSTEFYIACRGKRHQVLYSADMIIKSTGRLNEEGVAQIEDWMLNSKTRNWQWLAEEVRIGELQKGHPRPYHKGLCTFGFSFNLETIASQFLGVAALGDLPRMITGFVGTLKQTIHNLDSNGHDTQGTLMMGKFEIYPVREEGKNRERIKGLMLKWIALNLSTKMNTGEYTMKSFEKQCSVGCINLDIDVVYNVGLINAYQYKKYKKVLRRCSYPFPTRDIKKLMKLIGSAKFLGVKNVV
ncbi:polymerase [Salmon aquaparamyxovirus]|uniref:RNA-directed RNA polymerase L n=5 Tax=Aquaparamyxovirus TaxID=1232658 RepID=A0A3G2KTL4_9MONO|nr:polymerase [Salmon aquaparamyxovirus]